MKKISATVPLACVCAHNILLSFVALLSVFGSGRGDCIIETHKKKSFRVSPFPRPRALPRPVWLRKGKRFSSRFGPMLEGFFFVRKILAEPEPHNCNEPADSCVAFFFLLRFIVRGTTRRERQSGTTKSIVPDALFMDTTATHNFFSDAPFMMHNYTEKRERDEPREREMCVRELGFENKKEKHKQQGKKTCEKTFFAHTIKKIGRWFSCAFPIFDIDFGFHSFAPSINRSRCFVCLSASRYLNSGDDASRFHRFINSSADGSVDSRNDNNCDWKISSLPSPYLPESINKSITRCKSSQHLSRS